MNVDLPPSLDVMALPGITLFPDALLPLYIFEPRYREMLARALDSHRMFAVGHLQGGDDESEVHAVGGAGLVRACVTNADGTSHLILQGVSRVRFARWVGTNPCRHAAVEGLESTTSNPETAAELRDEILQLCQRMAKKNREFGRMADSLAEESRDLEAFSDLVSANTVADAVVRQRLMEELDVVGQLEIVAAYLTQLFKAA